jgi:hypothetical protein
MPTPRGSLPTDKHHWQPSLIPGVVTLVSSVAADPFVTSGAEEGVLRPWLLSSRDNRHMGVL